MEAVNAEIDEALAKRRQSGIAHLVGFDLNASFIIEDAGRVVAGGPGVDLTEAAERYRQWT